MNLFRSHQYFSGFSEYFSDLWVFFQIFCILPTSIFPDLLSIFHILQPLEYFFQILSSFSEFCPKKSLGVGFRFFHLIELANDIEASCTFGQYWMIVPADHILLNSFPMWKWKMVKYQINCFSCCCCKFCAKGHCPTSLKLDCKFYLGLTIYLYRITKKCTGIMNKS